MTQQLHPAATVVVVRDGVSPDGAPCIETLMLRRNDRGNFGGMWVFPGGRVDPGDIDPAAPDDDLAAGRRAAAREANEEAAIVLDPNAMVVLSHWRPPSDMPKGFATWFFVATAPATDLDVTVDGTEIFDHAWLTPIEVLSRRDRGEMTLAPPTFVTLTTLASHVTVGTLVDALHLATPERFHTQIGDTDGVSTLFWHGDEVYASDPGPAGARHRLLMAEPAWHYLRMSPHRGDSL